MKNGYQPLSQIRKSFKVRWYRSPIENSTLKELCLRSNLKGFTQALSHIGLFIITGTLTSLCFIWEEWVWFCLTLWLHGTIGVFFASATHELGHGTVFKTQKLNSFFLKLMGILVWWNYHAYSMSHTFHHRYTMHPIGDREAPPLRKYLNPLVLIELFTFNFRGFFMAIYNTFLTAFGRFNENPLELDHAKGSTQWNKATSEVYPEKYHNTVVWARIVIGFHSLLLLVSIMFQLWWLSIVITGFAFVGQWLVFFISMPQHAGLPNNIQDFRINTRSIRLNPIFEFLMWHQNWHIEHHMYAGVPCYNLKKLNKIINEDLPEPRGLISTWVEMHTIWKKQQEDKEYNYYISLPSTANAAITSKNPLSEVRQDNDNELVYSIGALAPEEDARI